MMPVHRKRGPVPAVEHIRDSSSTRQAAGVKYSCSAAVKAIKTTSDHWNSVMLPAHLHQHDLCLHRLHCRRYRCTPVTRRRRQDPVEQLCVDSSSISSLGSVRNSSMAAVRAMKTTSARCRNVILFAVLLVPAVQVLHHKSE